MSYITDFKQIRSIAEDGGKGHHLKELSAMGFNVPPGIVVSAEFYRNNYPKPPEFDYSNFEMLDRQCSEMISRVEALELPEEFLQQLNQKIKDFGESARFAVRSSSTYEDLASSAFAGQHETYLNVRPTELEKNIKKCFASLWQKHAVLYRSNQGFEQQSASMAVVIQKMINAQTAGVAFSVDPVSGNLDHVLIEANFGIGESVVGGEAVTDSWIVDTKDWSIVERRISEKEEYVVAVESGVETRKIDRDEKQKPCLEDGQIIEIAKTVKQIQIGFGCPQDVEWAYQNHVLYILQARPQTTIPPHFTRDESAERYPEPITPLTWSYAEEAFNNSLEYSLAMMGINLPTRPWFAMKNSNIYGNQNAVKLLSSYRLIDFKDIGGLADRLAGIFENMRWVFELPNTWMRDLEKYLVNIGRLNAVSFDSFDIKDFHVYFRQLFEVANQYFKPNIAISMTQAFLTRALYEYITAVTGDAYESQNILKQIITAAGTKTGQINREIYQIAMAVRENQELFKLLALGGQKAYESINRFEHFNQLFENFIENYGHREITFDYYKPTWVEAPWVVLDLIHLTASSGYAENPEQKEKNIKLQAYHAAQELLSKTPEGLKYFISELIRLANTYTYLDDLEHFETTRVNVLARKAAAAFGERFVINNQLEDKYDIFFLTKEEIETITTFELSDEIKDRISARKKEYNEACISEPEWDLNQISECEEVQDSNVFKGIPGSPGECEGEIYIVRGPEDFAGMPDNTIIVARTTNPAWTPLFYKAKGLVTESGGPLSHGAVTARELGLPAVMCVKNALKLFKNQEIVRIDGRKGTVVRL